MSSLTETLASGSDTGTSSSDDITSDTTPTLGGVASTAGDTITLYDSNGNTLAASFVSNATTGLWSIAVASPLPRGTDTIQAIETDANGHFRAATSLNVTIMTTAGTPGSLALSDATDTGTKGDGITTDTSPTLTGTTDAGDVVTVSITPQGGGASVSGTATVSGTSWSYTPATPLAAGSYTISATALDLAGNTSAASTLALTISSGVPAPEAAPTLAAGTEQSTSGHTDATMPTLTGSGTSGDTVTVFDGAKAVGTGTITSGNWSVQTSPLAIGTHYLTVEESNVGGATSDQSASLTLTVDPIPAAPTALALASGDNTGVPATGHITDHGSPSITGNGSTGDTLTLIDTSNGGSLVGTATVGSGGTWSVSGALSDGTHILAATETDSYGHVSAQSAAFTLTVDTQAPASSAAPTLASASDSGTPGDSHTDIATPSITGTGTNGDTITLFDGSTSIGNATVSGGTWSITTGSLTAGLHAFSSTETSTAGLPSASSGTLNVTIDPVPTAPTGLALDSSGTPSTGTLTRNSTPSIDGAATAAGTITLFDGSNPVGTVTVSGGGAWSVPTSTLADGPHTLTATETDSYGNVSAASGAFTLTVDTMAPVAPTGLALTPASDSGSSDTDNLTNVTMPTLTGTAEAGSTVTLLDGAVPIGTATADGSGSFTLTATTALTSGANVLTVTATDAAGNLSSASGSLVVTLDTTAPDTPGAPTLTAGSDTGTSADGHTTSLMQTLFGTGTYGDSVQLSITANADSSDHSPAPVQVGSDGTWSETVSLAVGSYTVTETETDPAGNHSSPSPTFTLTIDPVPTAPADLMLDSGSSTGQMTGHITDSHTPTIDGTGTSGDVVSLFNGGTFLGSATVSSGGTWNITSASLADGAYTLTATEADAHGNPSPPSSGLALTVDTTAPVAPTGLALAPASDSGSSNTDNLTNVTMPTLTGTAEVGSTVILSDNGSAIGTATADGSGSFTLTATTALTSGANVLTVTATDAAGNLSSASGSLVVTLDTTAPVAPTGLALTPASDSGSSDIDNLTNVTMPTLTGTAEAGSTVILSDNGSAIGTATADGSGSFTLTATTALTSGANVLTVTATDAAGNLSSASGSLVVTLDTTAPVAPTGLALTPASDSGSSDTDNLTNVTMPTLTGTAEAGSTVTLLDGAVPIGTATADGSGSFTLTATTALTSGANVLTVTATDAAGNLSSASGSLVVTLDTTAPDTPGAPTLTAGSDTGTSADGHTTSLMQTLFGTGTYGDSVQLSITANADSSDHSPAPVQVGSDGTWSETVSLAVGSYTVTETETDPAGNHSSPSPTFTLTIDPVPTAPADLMLDSGSSTGQMTGHITDSHTPTIDGTGTSGDVVSLFNGGTFLGSATVSSGGTWNITSASLADGAYTLTATEADAHGNPSPPSSGLALTVDTTAPTVSSVTPSGTGIASDTGDLDAGKTVTLTLGFDEVVYVGGGTPTLSLSSGGTATYASGSGSNALTFTYTVGSTDNTTNLVVSSATLGGSGTIADAAGNPVSLAGATAANASGHLRIDTTAPTISLATTIAGDNVVNASEAAAGFAISGTTTGVEDGQTVTLTLSGTSLTYTGVVTNNAWSITVPHIDAATLADGSTYTVSATVADAAGNSVQSPATQSLLVEERPPVVAISGPVAGDDVLNASEAAGGFTISGTTVGVPNAGLVQVAITDAQGGVVTLSAAVTSNAWSASVTQAQAQALANGTATISASATDSYGNLGTSAPRSLAVHEALPTVTSIVASGPGILGGTGDLKAGGIVTFTVGLSETVTLSSGAPPSLALSGGGMASYISGSGSDTLVFADAVQPGQDTPDLAVTGLVLNGATIVDSYANPLVLSSAQINPAGTLQVDTMVPAVPTGLALAPASDSGSSHTDNLTNVATPTLTGTAEVGSTVILSDNGSAIGTATADGSGSFTLTATTALTSGANVLTVTATDAAGNLSSASGSLVVTLDTTAPMAPAGLALTPASDSGSSNTDKLTNVTMPTLTGTAEAGSKVMLYDNAGSTPLATVMADSTTGSFTFAAATLAQGANVLTVTATDAAGNVSQASGPLLVTLDTVAPLAPAGLALTPASDSGSSNTDNLTNVAHPTLTGTAEAGSTVILHDGAAAIGTATANGSGSFTLTATTALTSGANVLTVTATDAAGNLSSASGSLVVTLDTTAPVAPTGLALTPVSDGSATGTLTNVAMPTLTGTAEAGSTVTLLDSGTAIGTTTADGSGHFTLTATTALSEGANTLTVTATDAAGNVSQASSAQDVTLDDLAPTIVSIATSGPGISGGTGDLAAGSAVTFTVGLSKAVTLSSGGMPTLSLNDGGTASYVSGSGSGTLVFAGTVAAGQNVADLAVTGLAFDGGTLLDAAGNALVLPAATIDPPGTLQVDTTAPGTPSGLALAPASDSSHGLDVTNVTMPTLTGTAEAGSVVTLLDGAAAIGTATAGSGGSFTLVATGSLSQGVNTLSATATDAAGNVSQVSAPLVVTLDTVAPAAPSAPALASGSDSSHGLDVTNVAHPTLTGTAEAGSVVTLRDGTAAIGTATADTGGRFSIAATAALVEGANLLTVSATDAAGNVSAASPARSVTLDTAAPAATAIRQTGSTGLTGVAEAGSTVTLSNGTTPVAALVVGSNGTWSFLPSTLAAGSYVLAATVSDQAGNVSAASGPLNVTVSQDHSFTVTAPDASGASTTASYNAQDVLQPGTTQVSPASGATLITASATGSDVVSSRGADTIQAGGGTDLVFASGPSASVIGGTGSLVFVAGGGSYVAGGGSGVDTLYGGTGSNSLTGGAGINSILVAGSGNTSLMGGAGSAAVMFGGSGTTSFTGSAGGGDTMVGGTGTNTFAMTNGNAAFGSPGGTDTYDTGTGSALVVEGGGTDRVDLGSGSATIFGGTGADTYVVTRGLAATAEIIGFKASDHLTLTGGFTVAAVSSTTNPSFGTTVSLTDGTRIILFGATINAAQIGVN